MQYTPQYHRRGFWIVFWTIWTVFVGINYWIGDDQMAMKGVLASICFRGIVYIMYRV